MCFSDIAVPEQIRELPDLDPKSEMTFLGRLCKGLILSSGNHGLLNALLFEMPVRLLGVG